MLYSSGCEYAIRALTHLAERPSGRYTSLAEIAGAEDLPQPFLGKLLQDLVRAKLLASTRGPGGGYALARPPEEVSLLEIREAVDGLEDLERCAVGLEPCSDDAPCPLHDTFRPLRQSIRRYLAATSLRDLAAGLARKRALLPDREVESAP